jgi:hypothetical protein
MEFGVDAYRDGTTPPVIDPPAPTELPFALNAGGVAVPPFGADAYVSGGLTYTNWTGAIDRSGATDAAPETVYQDERYGAMTYTIPGLVAGTLHRVRLHFCENYFTAAGQRRFDVAVNGTPILDDFDVFAAAGAAHRALVEEREVAADASGRIVIDFTVVTNFPVLNGIEILAPAPACTDADADGACGADDCNDASAAVHPGAAEICGDAVDQDCDGSDTACGASCGDGACNGDESCGSCERDCGACPASCGDGECLGDESCDSCDADCGPCSCGDGTCEGDDTCGNCPEDCGACDGTVAEGEGLCKKEGDTTVCDVRVTVEGDVSGGCAAAPGSGWVSALLALLLARRRRS